MGITAITGSASGIGSAVRGRLENDGDLVIGVDLKDAEVIADLSTTVGREAAVRLVLERCEGRLNRLVLCAGVGAHTRPPSKIVSINYFGTVEVLDGLFPALQRETEAAAVVMCSNSAQLFCLDDMPLVSALLDRDEGSARRIADEMDNSPIAYLASKNALGKAVRREAGRWAKGGVRLNAVAPGPVRTPLLQGDLDDPMTGEAIRNLSIPLGRMGEPEEIAELVCFLFSRAASWIHGSIYYIDGGIDAEVRPDRF